MIKIAFSKTDITPNIPCHLSGFLKERIATKVHDPLSARSILFYDDINNEYYQKQDHQPFLIDLWKKYL